MAATLRIQDGTPVWVSSSIIPSRDTVVSSASGPQLATVQVNSNDVFVYVKVENPGTVDLGECDCAVDGAWAAPLPFHGFLDDPNGLASETQFGVTFTASPGADSITGPGINLLLAAAARRAWAWSPDGRFFALVTSQGPLWVLLIATLQDVTRSNGSTVSKGLVIMTASGTFAATPIWTNANFGWAGSRAVVATGPYAGAFGDVDVRVACPFSATLPTWGAVLANYSGAVSWLSLVSPCGSAVAIVPRRLNPSAPQLTFSLVSTATAMLIPFRQNNVPLASIGSTGASPSITTNFHAAYGVTVDTGNGTSVDVDDPDCTFAGGGVVVRVDRVKASTLPTANLGVLPIGTAVLGALRQNQARWVQVPNQNGWANQSEKHWCLLGQAYTSDLTTVPRPWNGQATNPPPFPTANDNCAQRNIDINP